MGICKIWLNRSGSDHESFNYWASVSESHTGAFNVEFCLYGTSVCCGQNGKLSLSIVSHTVTATTLSCLHYIKKEKGKLVPPDNSDCSVVCTVIINN